MIPLHKQKKYSTEPLITSYNNHFKEIFRVDKYV